MPDYGCTHQSHHLGEVVGICSVYTILVLAKKERHLLWEDVEDAVEGREGVLRDEDEEDTLDVLDPGLV